VAGDEFGADDAAYAFFRSVIAGEPVTPPNEALRIYLWALQRRPGYPELAWKELTGAPRIPRWLVEEYDHWARIMAEAGEHEADTRRALAQAGSGGDLDY
jgi:hypothetical protein